MPIEHLKHRFLNLTHVAFCAVHVTENEFKVTCQPMDHRFLDLTQVTFC